MSTRKVVSAVALFLASACFITPARADLHTWDINEIFSSSDGTVQFIELRETAGTNNQHRLATSVAFENHTISSLATGEVYTYTTNLPSTATAFKFFLMGTPAFAALPGAPALDYTFAPGQVPFFGLSSDTINFADVDSFSFDDGELPLNGTLSLLRTGATATNSPTNFAGVTGSVVVPEPGSFVLALLAGAMLFGCRALGLIRSR